MKAYKQHKCSELENFRLQYLPFFCFGRFLTNLYSPCLYGFYCNWHIVAFDGSSVSVIQVWMSAPKWHVCHFSLLIFGDIKRTKNKNIYKKIMIQFTRESWVCSPHRTVLQSTCVGAVCQSITSQQPRSDCFSSCHEKYDSIKLIYYLSFILHFLLVAI